MKFNYEPTFKNVRGIHIGIIVAVLFLIYWSVMRGGSYTPNVDTGVNGDGASAYLNVADTTGWIEYQYNSLGSSAGAGIGESS